MSKEIVNKGENSDDGMQAYLRFMNNERGNAMEGFNGVHIMKQPIMRQVIIIEKEPTLFDMIPKMITLSIYIFIAQTFFAIWKRINKRSYDVSIFFILLFFPPIFLVYIQSYFLPVCWLAFLSFILFNIFSILKRAYDKTVMRNIYNIFKILFIVSNIGIFIGQASVFVFFYFKSDQLKYPVILLLFFLYFGLLTREMIFFLSELVAIDTGFYSKEGVPGKKNNNELCMICTKTFDVSDRVHTLVCNHSFHEDCIKGWCLLGKKCFCPYCQKRVESSSLPAELWHKTEVWFYPLINTLRSFIVFTLTLTAVISYKLKYQ